MVQNHSWIAGHHLFHRDPQITKQKKTVEEKKTVLPEKTDELMTVFYATINNGSIKKESLLAFTIIKAAVLQPTGG